MKQDHAPAAPAAPADPEATPVIGPAAGRRRRRASTLWQLCDAGDLVSCHASKADAIAARADLLACHLAEFPRDRHYLEAALMIEPGTRSAAEGDNDGPGPKPGRVEVWALWDAADLVALHATEPGARNALRAHLIQNTEEDPAAQAPRAFRPHHPHHCSPAMNGDQDGRSLRLPDPCGAGCRGPASRLLSLAPHEERVLARLERCLRTRSNTLITGSPGFGKTTVLRTLAASAAVTGDADPHRYVLFVPAAGCATVPEILDAVLEASLLQIGACPHRSLEIPEDRSALALLGELADVWASAGAECVILLDDLRSEAGLLLFGSLRDDVWDVRLTWIVTTTPQDGAELLRPPVDAFFLVVLTLDPGPEGGGNAGGSHPDAHR